MFVKALPRLVASVLVSSLLAGPGLAQEATLAKTFEGGASSILEVHGNWRMVCNQEDDSPVCLVSQGLADEQSGQRILLLELEPAPNGALEGTLLLPFGLLLTEGVKTQVDAVLIGEATPFSACYEVGCSVNLSFPPDQVGLLRRGSSLNFLGSLADTGESVTLAAPLNGISTAIDRAQALLATAEN